MTTQHKSAKFELTFREKKGRFTNFETGGELCCIRNERTLRPRLLSGKVPRVCLSWDSDAVPHTHEHHARQCER